MRVSATVFALALATAAVPCVAVAQTGSWKVSVGAGSDNRARDASKSNGESYVWGRALWNSPSGLFYAGPAVETLNMGGADEGYALMTGIRPSFGGFEIDIQSSYKALIDASKGYDDGTFEAKIDLSRKIGDMKTRLRAEYSPDGLGATKEWTWVSAQVTHPLTRTLNASAELGYRDQKNNISYTGYNVGVTYAVTSKMGLDLRWHGTDANIPGEQHNDRVVASVTYGF